MRNLNKKLENKIIDYKKLIEYGFIKKDDIYLFETKINDNNFNVVVEISKEKQISKVIDLTSNYEYTLVDVNEVCGKFKRKIKRRI